MSTVRALNDTEYIDLSTFEAGNIIKDCRIPGCEIESEEEDNMVISSQMGRWTVKKEDWVIEEKEIIKKPYSEADGFRYVPGCPYFHLPIEDEHSHRKAIAYSSAACLLGLNIGPIKSLDDYLEVLYKHGTGTYRAHNTAALREIGIGFALSYTVGPAEIEDEIDAGRPLALAIVAKGTHRTPFGMTYYVCLYGYSKDSWLLHDPCGRLDIKNGMWESTVEGAGKGITYDRKMAEKRIFYGGGASGWGILRFRES